MTCCPPRFHRHSHLSAPTSLLCLTQGSCYDPADGAAVSTGPARRSRTRRSTGCSSSKPGENRPSLSLSLCLSSRHSLSFLSLFFHPQYKQNQEMFKQTARLWSHIYAGAPVTSPDYKHKIDKLCAMGFDTVRTAVCLCCSMFKILHNTHM